MKTNKQKEGSGDWRERLDSILIGIDDTDDTDDINGGWWETSTGQEFGIRKKAEVKDLIQSLIEEEREKMVKELIDLTETCESGADTSMDEWRGFKCLRNALRDRYIKEIRNKI